MRFFNPTLTLLALLICCSACEQINPEDEKPNTESTKDSGSDGSGDSKGGSTTGGSSTGGSNGGSSSSTFHGFDSIEDYYGYYGSETHPIPLADMLANGCLYDYYTTATAYITVKSWIEEAYIVGYTTGLLPEAAIFSARGAAQSNILIAAEDSVRDASRCVPVQLSTGGTYGTVRKALNLYDNPTMLGRKVKLFGRVEKYYGVVGVKLVSAYKLVDEE